MSSARAEKWGWAVGGIVGAGEKVVLIAGPVVFQTRGGEFVFSLKQTNRRMRNCCVPGPCPGLVVEGLLPCCGTGPHCLPGGHSAAFGVSVSSLLLL